KAGAQDALHDVRKQYKRNHGRWSASDDTLPVIATIAAQFNDPGMNRLFGTILGVLQSRTAFRFAPTHPIAMPQGETPPSIIPPKRVRYLSEIAENNRSYDNWVNAQA